MFKRWTGGSNSRNTVEPQTKPEQAEENPEQCEHDWEVVGYDHRYFKVRSFERSGWLFKADRTSGGLYKDFRVDSAKKAVCLICGECLDEAEVARAEIEMAEKRYREHRAECERRQKLAKQMWKDCKGGDDETV